MAMCICEKDSTYNVLLTRPAIGPASGPSAPVVLKTIFPGGPGRPGGPRLPLGPGLPVVP